MLWPTMRARPSVLIIEPQKGASSLKNNPVYCMLTAVSTEILPELATLCKVPKNEIFLNKNTRPKSCFGDALMLPFGIIV